MAKGTQAIMAIGVDEAPTAEVRCAWFVCFSAAAARAVCCLAEIQSPIHAPGQHSLPLCVPNCTIALLAPT